MFQSQNILARALTDEAATQVSGKLGFCSLAMLQQY